MLNSDRLSIENIVNQTRSSERKFREGDFKGAVEDKREVRSLLNSKFCDKNIIKKFKEYLSNLYASKFDLINDHKLRINEFEINKIVKLLEQKSDEKYHKGDFKGAIRALRRSEKYLAKKNISVWFFYKVRLHRYIVIFFYKFIIMPQSTLESLLFFLALSLLASYLVKIKYGTNLKGQK